MARVGLVGWIQQKSDQKLMIVQRPPKYLIRKYYEFERRHADQSASLDVAERRCAIEGFCKLVRCPQDAGECRDGEDIHMFE